MKWQGFAGVLTWLGHSVDFQDISLFSSRCWYLLSDLWWAVCIVVRYLEDVQEIFDRADCGGPGLFAMAMLVMDGDGPITAHRLRSVEVKTRWTTTGLFWQ
jgi:hypothetical protein